MAKQITQQTFDNVVKENIEEFDMTPEEAVQDAVQQFEIQGINLDNIVKDPTLYGQGNGIGGSGDITSVHPVLEAFQKLNLQLEAGQPDFKNIINSLEKIRDECNIDLAHRCLAGNHQAYSSLMKTMHIFSTDIPMTKAVLQSFCALLNGQPDLLEEDGSSLFVKLLDSFKSDWEILELVVRVIRLCCVKHEINRQTFVGRNVIVLLTELLTLHQSVPSLVKEVCFALRVFTIDDDIRVPFGKAHEHAKMIVTEGCALKAILKICEVYAHNVNVLGELFLTLGSLAVRDEFCKEVLNLGGVNLILQAFEHNIGDKAIVRQALVVLKSLAGSDDVKLAAVKLNAVELVVAAMTKHANNAAIAEVGCGVLVALTLRNPEHCARVIECKGHETVVQVMKIHAQETGVQKQCCMALRNLVVRTREYNPLILELGAESLLNKAIANHKSCEDEAKAALRDLDCAVQLKELWTGQKGSLQQ